MARAGQPKSGQRLPSTRTSCGGHAQGCNRPAHGQEAGVEDVQGIDLLHVGPCQGPGNPPWLGSRSQGRERRAWFRRLESSSPRIGRAGSRMTAAAATGPAGVHGQPGPTRRPRLDSFGALDQVEDGQRRRAGGIVAHGYYISEVNN